MFDVTLRSKLKHAIVRSLIILSRYIKLSSPKLNNMAIVGSCLIYGAVILLGVDHATLIHETGFPFVCMVRRFLLYNLKSLIKLLELFLTHRSQFSCFFVWFIRVEHISFRRDSRWHSAPCSPRPSASTASSACATACSKTRYFKFWEYYVLSTCVK